MKFGALHKEAAVTPNAIRTASLNVGTSGYQWLVTV